MATCQICEYEVNDGDGVYILDRQAVVRCVHHDCLMEAIELNKEIIKLRKYFDNIYTKHGGGI